MRLASVLWYTALCVVFICIFVDVAAAGKSKQGKKKNKRKKPGACKVTASKLEGKPFKAACRDGLISSISVVGYHGKKCQGLTPDLFVQMNSCYWKKNCTLTYSTNSTNFMLKLFKGKMADCVTKQPEYFHIKYECTTKKAKSPLIVREPKKGKKSKGKALKAKQGVALSHEDHPWLYRRHQLIDLRKELTLKKPNRRSLYFFFTIRTLNLMWGDNLTVKWTQDDKTWDSGHVFGSEYDLSKGNTFSVTGPSQVSFVLDTHLHTNGGEGFVICFKWSRKNKKPSDTCKKLIVPRGC